MPQTPAPSPCFSRDDIERFRENLRAEVDGSALYRLLAAAESDPHLSELFERLAQNEDKHLALWEEKLREAGASVPRFRPSWRVRMLGWLAKRFGVGVIMPVVTRMELAATDMYDTQPEAVAANLPADERSHARLFREIGRTHRGGGVDIARIEGRHRTSSGNALRAAILGANDGLVSNFLLVIGVAGASPGRDVVLLSGIAGLLAGAISMGLGEWVSVRSSAESFERQLAIEEEELALMPEEEEEELTLIYQAKGFPLEEARATAKRILSDQTTALETLAREELGMSPEEAGNAWIAALTSFVMFSVGAVLPVLPWLFVGGTLGIALSGAASGLGLFAVGAVVTLFTGRGAVFSGTRMLVLGFAGAVATFLIGKAVGGTAGV